MLILVGAPLGVLAGCGGGDSPSDASSDALDGAADAADAADAVDAGPECAADTECDDGVSCTHDSCDAAGRCRNTVDPAICDDGVFCNGAEICDPLAGCAPGPLQTCSDEDVCTIDRCDEAAKTCRHMPRDFDEDGEADFRCEGGTDCDDRDPFRGSLIAEICLDSIDNDCDTLVDEPECGRPAHDLCDDALDVSAGGVFSLDAAGAASDYELSCGLTGRRDLVARFTLSEAASLRVQAQGTSTTSIALQTSCGDAGAEFDCARGYPGTLRRRRLEPGTYFLVLQDRGGELVVEVTFGPPVDPPTNESCASPMDLGAGASTLGSFVDVLDDHETECGAFSAGDLVYSITVPAGGGSKDLLVSALSLTGESLSFSVQRSCGDELSSLRCARGSPAGTRIHELPEGSYFIIVEGSSSREIDFSLDAQLLAPTPVPAGDTCATAIPMELGIPVIGTLADKQDDHVSTCSYFYREAVYRIDLLEPSDISLEVDGRGTYMSLSLRSDCLDSATELRCLSGSPARTSLRGLPAGIYYVHIEAYSGTGFEIRSTVRPPTPIVPVSGNGTCASAHGFGEAGGVFSGDTTGLLDNLGASCGLGASSADAFFRFDLTTPRRLIATTDGSAFDTVLHLHRGACGSLSEIGCDDDGGEGTRSRLDLPLEAGTYLLVVDGFGSGAAGRYELEVQLAAP
ncbi:MAG: putative metal-binding motif-containing protein [Myxococcales bacterium]|nr:putative metal-binding motif-containing protein [Myxococcales bacterium]